MSDLPMIYALLLPDLGNNSKKLLLRFVVGVVMVVVVV